MPVGPTRSLPITDARRLSAALEGLDERERCVLELRYGLRGERQHSLAEVGGLLGVSGERARQLEGRALWKLGLQASADASAASGARKARQRLRPSAPAPRDFLRPSTLLLLRLQPAHGYDLIERLRELGMSGVDYPFLRGLEEEGFLRSSWAPASGVGPARRIYRLTSKGTKQLQKDVQVLGEVMELLNVFFGHYDELLARLERSKARRRRETPQRGR